MRASVFLKMKKAKSSSFLTNILGLAVVAITICGVGFSASGAFAAANTWVAEQSPTISWESVGLGVAIQPNYCQSQFGENVYLYGSLYPIQACSIRVGSMDFTSYTTYALYDYRSGSAVKFPGDTNYSPVDIGIWSPGQFDAVPGRDRMVQYDGSTAIVHDNVTANLTKMPAGGVINGQNEYHYTPEIAYTYQRQDNSRPSIGTLHAISSNGKWLVVFDLGVGLVRINLDTYETLKMTGSSVAAATGAQLDVSDDGAVALYAGYGGTSALVFDGANCGTGDISATENPSPCPYFDAGSYIYSHNSSAGNVQDVDISDDGRMLRVKSCNQSGECFIFTLSKSGEEAPEETVHRLEYLALGDSYSSGEGDIDNDGSWYQFSNEESERCHLSRRSYPYLLRDLWYIDPSEMKSVACSGAKVLPDFYGGGVYYGQFGQFSTTASAKREEAQAVALQDFTPGILRQIDFVKNYKPKVLTFTGGGNDVGFADIIRYCAQPKLLDVSCGYVWNSQMQADLNRTIDDQYQYNKAFIERIKETSPATKVYMIGYPQFVSSDAQFCLENSMILDLTEREVIRRGVSRLNNILKKVARDTGIYYIDIENSLKGGEICEGSKYMSGPIGTFVVNRQTVDTNMYHPNDLGHLKIANAIAQSVSSGMDYEIIDIPIEQNGRKIVKTAVLPNYAGVGSTYTVTVGPGTFEPNGRTTAEMFSKPVVLATENARLDGSMNVNITIPPDTRPGYHLFTLTGTDDEGKAIQVQQFITVISNNPEDMDSDGINNENDMCFVVNEWFINDKDVCETNEVKKDGLNGSLLDESSMIFSRKSDTFLTSGMSIRDEQITSVAPTQTTPLPGPDTPIVDKGTPFSNVKTGNLTVQPLTLWLILGICTIIALGTFLYREKNRKT